MINSDEWVHLTLVRDAANQSVELFVNGTTAGSGTYAEPPDGGTASNLNLGNLDLPSSFIGLMDDVRIYDSQLSLQDIADVMGGGDAAAAPVLHYDFENVTVDVPNLGTGDGIDGFLGTPAAVRVLDAADQNTTLSLGNPLGNRYLPR